ncbi:DNA-binding protein [Belliella sp. DSM 111904]|uniref:DNA-binding protein n=1 Tax=Belliella filtrata TaxID=2923435 RepID=A0ABS9UVA7_9BACT|nr:glycosyl hydrolase [Belliella filtrata]MCH7408101.1 DNA-binding protein [Belliella filtrata]
MNKIQEILKCFLLIMMLIACQGNEHHEATFFEPTYESSQPWAYWYWMYGAYSKEGITADLEAMKEAGLAGAYLMSIRGPKEPPLIDPPIIQTSPEWWEMVSHALHEADRLGLQIAMHSCDGFAVAGGPWVTPELSMQKLVWTDVNVQGGKLIEMSLEQPETKEDYYKDVAVFAYPVPEKEYRKSSFVRPKVSSNISDKDLTFLLDDSKDETFSTNEPAWIEYVFEEPFTLRNIKIKVGGSHSYQAQRLKLEVSNDGRNYATWTSLVPPRHGWQDWDAAYTHAIEAATFTHFRLVYDPEGTEPGSEDLDAAKWKPSLKVKTIELSEEPKIGDFEGKSGLVWRISPQTTDAEIHTGEAAPLEQVIDISDSMDADGNLSWEAPEGHWKVIRFGHTSTGHTNATGGGGLGLEVDKFNPEAVKLQFDSWFGKAVEVAGPNLTGSVLSLLHIDSWEAGSQNWSPYFLEEFQKRRGYNLKPYLPVMAGFPINGAEFSEQVLYDVRQTISELIVDVFFEIMRSEAATHEIKFSAENVAPTMISDGLLHFSKVDFPGGEFWLNSPTHDKPNDMLDAISGGHIYGKQIIQAEAFTQLRMDWDEHPGSLKTIGDRNYALGINRFFYHVFVHNPWLDRKPGMTLDGVGLYFQRDQTWWKPGKAWIDYAQRVQYHLQKGKPVIDLAVFTGEGLPSRAVLPDRLAPFLPGLVGEKVMQKEASRWANENQPTHQRPKGVTHGSNIALAEDWTDAFRGYKYDSFNPDALLNLASVKDGKVVLSTGMEYSVLVFPGNRKMNPNADKVSYNVLKKIWELVNAGATIMVDSPPTGSPSLALDQEGKGKYDELVNILWKGYDPTHQTGLNQWSIGKGKIIQLPYLQESLEDIGIPADVLARQKGRERNHGVAWSHRKSGQEEVYFISNQLEEKRQMEWTFRVTGKIPQIYDPVKDEYREVKNWVANNGNTTIPLTLDKNESLFVIFDKKTTKSRSSEGSNDLKFSEFLRISSPWKVQFDPAYKGPTEEQEWTVLKDWSKNEKPSIRYYSGTASYQNQFQMDEIPQVPLLLNLGEVNYLAEVIVNGQNCGVAWTFPFAVDISKAIKKGNNELIIKVSNTWANRIIGDFNDPNADPITWSVADLSRIKNNPLMPSGLIGPVSIDKKEK